MKRKFETDDNSDHRYYSSISLYSQPIIPSESHETFNVQPVQLFQNLVSFICNNIKNLYKIHSM